MFANLVGGLIQIPNKKDFSRRFAFCLLLFANFSYASDYAGCKSFCADTFRECIGAHKGISPESCASISNDCLAKCKTLSNSASPRVSESNASNSNSGGASGFWVFVIGLGLVGALVMFISSKRSRQAKLAQFSNPEDPIPEVWTPERIQAEAERRIAEHRKELENLTPEELAKRRAIKKWTDEAVNTLLSTVGSESPVSVASVEAAAEALGFTTRSVTAKLRQLGREVEG